MPTLVARAAAFAAKAHGAVVNEDGTVGQLRKYSKDPYTVHTQAVATVLAVMGMPEYVVAAAHMHDTVEDCDVSSADIEAEFGPEIAKLVAEVTDVPKTYGNRAERKVKDLERLANASSEGQTIKVADLIDNTASIVQHDHRFARTYLAEKEAALLVLTRADPALLELAWKTLREAQEHLVQVALAPPGTADFAPATTDSNED